MSHLGHEIVFCKLWFYVFVCVHGKRLVRGVFTFIIFKVRALFKGLVVRARGKGLKIRPDRVA